MLARTMTKREGGRVEPLLFMFLLRKSVKFVEVM